MAPKSHNIAGVNASLNVTSICINVNASSVKSINDWWDDVDDDRMKLFKHKENDEFSAAD